MGADAAGMDRTHAVIEALYDLPLDGSWREVQSALCDYWSHAGEEPPVDELSLLERHFARALAYLQQNPSRRGAWWDELQRVPLPAAVFDAAGEFLDANESGSECLARQDGGVVWKDSNLRAIREAIASLSSRSLSAASVATRDQAVLRLYLSRVPESHAPEAPLFLAVMVAQDLPDYGARLLRDQFGLTEREADLCLRMASGASLDDIARKSSTKRTTLRTHLANCFSKTGVKSQAELVSVVLHHLFAGRQLAARAHAPARLTPYLDPELHGHPLFRTVPLCGGRQLGYFEYGDPDGIPAVYLHGSLDAGLFMRSQKLNGNGVRLIAVERPGVGESTPSPDPSPEAYARDLVQLADALQLDGYAVIGRSMGSWDAVALTLADPSRARLLVLASGRLPVSETTQHAHEQPFYRALFQSIWQSEAVGKAMLRMLLLQLHLRGPAAFLQASGRPRLECELIANPLFMRHIRAVWLRSGMHGPDPVHAHLKLYRDAVTDPPWQNLSVPTVLVHGDVDGEVPVSRLEAQTQSFTQRQIVVFPGVGHMLVHLAMGEVLRVVAERWQGLPAAR